METALAELLKSCTVKLSIANKEGWGTGFFIAPERILTCAHVIEALGFKDIKVSWQERENFSTATIESFIKFSDLALLKLNSPIENQQCVYLDKEIKSGDDLYTFGYPDDFLNGAPVTFSCEGLTGGHLPWIKFKWGQARPGLSGSPLLNMRTGKVCGMVKFTRDRGLDLGGGGVPMKVICSQFSEIERWQKEFHENDRRWRDCLNPAVGSEEKQSQGSDLKTISEPIQRDITVQLPQKCPYQGLEPFTKDKARFFFGRDAEVELLRNQLSEHHLIFVIGSSGVGKSSLVQAGLVPSLEKEGWKILRSIKPGSTPISRLQEVFEDLFREQKKLIEFQNWYKNLSSAIANSENLAPILESLAGTQKLLLIVDQFEEIFTYCTEREKQSDFLNLLNRFAITSGRLFIVINMRADFELLLNDYPATSQLLNSGTIATHFLSRLQGENLKVAITQPARELGYEFGEGLLELILHDVNEENCLPLLQFTLKELWSRGLQDREHKQLLTRYYNDLGGLKGSLNKRADEIYEKLESDLQKEMAEYIFLSLVQTNQDTKDTRRRRKKEDLLNKGSTDEEREAINNVLNYFVDERLLITEEIKQKSWVDLAHETLMEGWLKFKEWREKDREMRTLINQIEEHLKEWEIYDRSDFYLLPASLIFKVDAITSIEEQRDKLEKQFQRNSDLKNFFNSSVEKYKKTQLVQAKELEQEAVNAQGKLHSSEPLTGFMQTLQLVNKCLKSRPLSNLPGSVQNTLRLAMEISRERNCFQGHTDKIKCVAISHNGQWIVSGSEDKRLLLWNSEGNCYAVFEGHTAAIWSVAFSPDDSWIVSGSADNTLRRWKLNEKMTDGQSIVQGEQIGKPFFGHKDWIRSVVVSLNGKSIVSGSKDYTWQLWDLEGNRISQSEKKHTDWIFSTAIWQDPTDPEKSFIVSGSVDGTIRLWNLKGEAIGEPFKGHKGWVRSIAITNNGQWIVSGSEDTTIRLWDLKGNCLKVFEGHENRVLSIAVWQKPNLSDGEDIGFIASCSADHTIRLWNFNGDLIGQPLKGHTDWVRDIKISTDGKFLVSGSRDQTVRLWDTGENLAGRLLGRQDGRILSVAFSSDGNLLVSGGEDKSIYLWNFDGTLIRKFKPHYNWIRSVRIIPRSNYIVSGSADNTLRLWKLDGTLVDTYNDGHNSWIRSIAVSPDGKHIVSSSNDKTLCLWEVTKSDSSNLDTISLKIKQCFRSAHDREVLSVAFSPDSQLIISSSADRTIKLWNLDGEIDTTDRTAFQGHKDRVMSVAFSPDGKYIVSASYDHTICLWSINGKKYWEGKLDDQVRCVAFSPDGQLIVSGSRDGTLQFWDFEGCKIGTPLTGHQDVVRSVKFSPNGQYVVSASEDGTLRLWEVGNWKDWLRVCCERISKHPSLREQTEVAREANEICNK